MLSRFRAARCGWGCSPIRGHLDTQVQNLTAAWHVVEHIYSNLTLIEPDMSVAPDLAESWEISEDGLTYTFHLHQGVMFHNGREVQAADVKASFERLYPETASERDLRFDGQHRSRGRIHRRLDLDCP